MVAPERPWGTQHRCDDETTFNLSANANITVDEFIYEEGGKNNSALFKIARGTVAFAAHQVAKTGDMKIATPTATMGIRGTSGVSQYPKADAVHPAGVASSSAPTRDGQGRAHRVVWLWRRPAAWPADAGGNGFLAARRSRRTLRRRGADDLAATDRAGSRLRATRFRGAKHRPADDRSTPQSALAACSGNPIFDNLICVRQDLRRPAYVPPGQQLRQTNARV